MAWGWWEQEAGQADGGDPGEVGYMGCAKHDLPCIKQHACTLPLISEKNLPGHLAAGGRNITSLSAFALPITLPSKGGENSYVCSQRKATWAMALSAGRKDMHAPTASSVP